MARLKREFEAGLRHATTGNSHSQPSSRWVPFCEFGKAKAVKGEGWAPPFISCAKDKAKFTVCSIIKPATIAFDETSSYWSALKSS